MHPGGCLSRVEPTALKHRGRRYGMAASCNDNGAAETRKAWLLTPQRQLRRKCEEARH
jgi:hypothetical protein